LGQTFRTRFVQCKQGYQFKVPLAQITERNTFPAMDTCNDKDMVVGNVSPFGYRNRRKTTQIIQNGFASATANLHHNSKNHWDYQSQWQHYKS
jgi:hypothetical protein